MRAESNVKPEQIIIEKTNFGMCEVIINTNVSEPLTRIDVDGKETESVYYEYESYRFELKWRTGLIDEISKNLDAWILYAKELELTPTDMSDKEKIAYLLQVNKTLVNDNAVLKEDNELLKGCIMEIADVVFA